MYKISRWIANEYLKNEVISHNVEVYAYCIEILLSTLLNGLIAFIISLLLKQFLEGLVFSFVFIIMRQLVGGYHADTHLKCILFFSVIFTLTLLLTKYLSPSFYLLVMVIGCFVSLPVNFILAPIEHINKPLSDEKKKKLRKKVRFTSAFFWILSFGILFLWTKSIWGLLMGMALLITSLLGWGEYLISMSRDIEKG